MPDLPDRIASTFSNSTVLITGGTGYIGKLLIEKLLRSCNEVKKIYILVRNKKGKTPEERLSDIFNNVVFSKLKEQQPNAQNKCKIIPGDVTEVDLGIRDEHRKLLQDEVEFIFHSAASTRFDDSVRVAVQINTRGTKYMLDLAQNCKKLKLFVHVSTAYAFPCERILYEESYEAPVDPYKILDSIDFDGQDTQENEALMGSSPNSYTFSKALAEQLVVDQRHKLPIIIARPSLVVPTYKEPIPGWCNNLQGAIGLFVGGGKGIIRSMYVKKYLYADFVAADGVVGSLLPFCWRYLNVDKENFVINLVGGNQVNVNWENLIETGKDLIYNELSFNMIAWYPGGTLVENKTIHLIYFWLFQAIPAVFYDALLMLLGYKPILVSTQKRIYKASAMLEYYTTRPWNFVDKNIRLLHKEMNERERETYLTLAQDFDLREYLKNSLLGARRYILKETDDMIPKARMYMKIMWFVDKVFKLLLVFALYHFVFKRFFD